MAHARTDTMDTRKILEPVVKERPARGREMVTQDFGEADARGTEGGRSVKRGQSEVFHEGYVGGQKYLVPDSNLEAMADMINLKMRKMETSMYVNDRELLRVNDADPEEEYSKKKESLLKKLNALAGDSDEETDETEEEETSLEDEESKEELAEPPTSEEEEESTEELAEPPTSEEEEESGEEGGEEEEETGEGEEEEETKGTEIGEKSEDKVAEPIEDDKSKGKEVEEAFPVAAKDEGVPNDEGKDELVPVYYHDPNIKRFLISGHFRSNKKPIFIVQQYEGPTVLRHKDENFYSKKSEEDVDIFTCGEFYKESILEEDASMRPVGLKTSPRKVVVDWRSRVYEEKFNDIFVGSDLDVQLVGSFIEHSQSALYTPMISITVRKGSARAASRLSDRGATIYVMRPIVENLFEREDAWRPRTPRRSGDRKRGNVTFDEGDGRIRTGFQYPKGAGATGPMSVYVTYPFTHVPPAAPRSSVASPSTGPRSSKAQARQSSLDRPRSSAALALATISCGIPRPSVAEGPSAGSESSKAQTRCGVQRSSTARSRFSTDPSDGPLSAARAPFKDRSPADGSGDEDRPSSLDRLKPRDATWETPQETSVYSRLRDSLRDTLLLPETTQGPEGTADLESPPARRRYIRDSLTAGESPADILGAFVNEERERRRERRRRERKRVTMSTALSKLFFPK